MRLRRLDAIGICRVTEVARIAALPPRARGPDVMIRRRVLRNRLVYRVAGSVVGTRRSSGTGLAATCGVIESGIGAVFSVAERDRFGAQVLMPSTRVGSASTGAGV